MICATSYWSTQLIALWTRLDQPEIGDAIALLREHFGLARAELVQRMWDASDGPSPGVDISLIYRWEKGARGRPRPRPSTRYRRLLGVVCERELLAINPDGRHEFLQRLTAVANVALPVALALDDDRQPPGREDVHDLAELTRHYLHMYGEMPTSALLLAVARHLDAMTDLVLGAASPAIAVQVRSMAARTAILAGWLSFETGDLGRAMRHWSIAESLARDASDAGLQALALGSRSRIYSSPPTGSHAADVTTSIAILDEAIALAAGADSSTLRTWLVGSRAALFGDLSGDNSVAEWDDVLDDLITAGL